MSQFFIFNVGENLEKDIEERRNTERMSNYETKVLFVFLIFVEN